MSERIDSAGGPASSASIEGLSGSESAGAFELDHSYVKANRKGELKLTKLNSDNYQSWADGMKILLSVKMMWSLINGISKQPGSLRPIDRMKWLADDVQTKAWIYTNLKDSQHNHIKKMTIANAMWKALKKVHGALDQGRLNFLKKKFFNYKAGTESIDEIASNLTRLQMIIRNIRETKASTDLNVALILINAVDDEAYALTKFHLKNMKNLTLIHIKKRLKIVEQRIKNDQGTDEVANKTKTKGKDKNNRDCYYCKRKGHIKFKCFK